jgi:hypothetical protein
MSRSNKRRPLAVAGCGAFCVSAWWTVGDTVTVTGATGNSNTAGGAAGGGV